MTEGERKIRFRALAADLQGVDLAVYDTYGRDPLEPIIGAGDRDARIGLFGRDPGRHEVEHGVPFIGKGGQLVREVLHRELFGAPPPDFEASRAVGRFVFWANTVPYKPVRNKAWGKRVQRCFHAPMADLLVHGWRGRDVIPLGRQALLWFGLHDEAAARHLLDFWARDDRFEASTEVDLPAPDGTAATFRLHPLPHPSPLNAAWHRKFPALLAKRLRILHFTRSTWRVGGGDASSV